MAAPAYISKGTKGSGTGTSISFTYMGSINANDMLFLLVLSVGNGSITVDSSWTLERNGVINSPPDANVKVYRKLATGSESGTENVTRSGNSPTSQRFMAQVYQYRGNNYLTVESSSQPTIGGTSSTITWNSVTVGGTERTLAALCVNLNGSDPGTPTGYTNSATDNDGAGYYLEANTLANVSSGSSVTATGGSSNGWTTVHISIYNNTPSVMSGSRSFIVN